MGANMIIVVFAVVVIGGMGSIFGAIVTGLASASSKGLTKVFYPRGLDHRDLRDHGHRAADQAGRPVRKGEVRRLDCDRQLLACAAHSFASTAGRLALLIVCGAAIVAPFVVYPVFLMKVLCFALFACAFNLLIGYRRPAVVRPCGVLRHRRLCRARTRPRSGACRRSSRSWSGAAAAALLGVVFGCARDPASGHLFRDDHAGAGADDLLLLPAGAVHPWRGRHPGGAARACCSASSISSQPLAPCTIRAGDFPRRLSC